MAIYRLQLSRGDIKQNGKYIFFKSLISLFIDLEFHFQASILNLHDYRFYECEGKRSEWKDISAFDMNSHYSKRYNELCIAATCCSTTGHHDNNIDLQQFAVTKQKEEF